jgi:AraC-like DNA-binding protein
MLIDPSYNRLTIAAIAFECGFNSLSSFNTAFKKMKGKTPSVFKRESQEVL